MNEQKKKRAYNDRVLQIEHGIFTPLLFSIIEVWGGNAVRFIQDYLIYCRKRDLPDSITMRWIRRKICFALLKFSLLHLRGSRTVCRKVAEFESDVAVSEFIFRI